MQPPHRGVPEAALHHDAEMGLGAAAMLVEAALKDVAARRRQALLEFLRLHRVREWRQVDALQAERRRFQRRAHADGRPDVVAARQGAAHVAGADPDGEENRLVTRLREAEALLDEAGERLQRVARIEQGHR